MEYAFLFCWAFIIITIAASGGAIWGAKVWAYYSRDHPWFLSRTGPVPDLRDFRAAIRWYLTVADPKGRKE